MSFDNIFSLSIILIYLILLMFIVNKQNRLINIILFSSICAPGFFINDVLVNVCDLVIPLAFILNIRKYLNNKYKVNFLVPLICYFACILISLITSFVVSEVSISMLLKSLRFLDMILAVYIIAYEVKFKHKIEYIVSKISLFSFLLCVFSLLLFLKQDSDFSSIQYMWIGNTVLHRAGGIYSESSNLGFNMLLITVFSLYCIKNNRNKYFHYLLLCFSIVINILSYTRITNLATIVVLFLYLIHKPTLKTVLVILVGITIFCILYFNVNVVNNFFNQRILALFHNSLSDSSSGRFDIWQEGYSFYLQSNRLLFGVGYKADLFFTDNCYLFVLTSTGIFGLICFIWFL